jgi:hypothetical protein
VRPIELRRATLAAVSAAVTALVVGAGGCATSAGPRMGGFTDAEARAPAHVESVDPCTFRTGRLVLEVEQALVREYPHYGATPGRRSEEPMLLTVLGLPDPSGTAPHDAEVAVHMAPAAYRPGDRIHALEGKHLLDRPLRTLRGRRLTVRLAENDRTSVPRWAQISETAAAASGGAVSVVGLPAPGGALVQALELVRKIDRDDLLLLAEVDLDAVAAALGPSSGAQRLRFQTSRLVLAGAAAGQPVAELVLIAYREPEPGCR